MSFANTFCPFPLFWILLRLSLFVLRIRVRGIINRLGVKVVRPVVCIIISTCEQCQSSEGVLHTDDILIDE
jgi:hypothetical protein